MTVSEVMDPAAVLAGATEDHRSVYRVLFENPDGVSREQLATRTGIPDRKLRDVIEELRVLAAVRPHPERGPLIVGFDTTTNTYCFARDREQAERILAYQASRIESMARALYHQARAAKGAFGSEGAPGVQTALFGADESLKAYRHWRTA